MKKKAFVIISGKEKNHLEEILALLDTAGYEPVYILPVRREDYISPTKLREMSYFLEGNTVDKIIFYGDPKPPIISKIMKETGIEVIDRTLLILEIFDLHAGSKEAKLQIELAKLRHLIPLIREMVRKKRMGELPGFMGPGMYDVEKYYRHIKSRISRLKKLLEKERKRREVMRRQRTGIPHVTIVGYASAGKTSLFNSITGESKPIGSEYFTTLQPKHKGVYINGTKVIFIDTVGFIRNIPPEIIEAFHATLEETTYSDLILFVVDVSESYEQIIEKIDAGLEILSRIEADIHPIIVVLNKIDKANESIVIRIKEELNSNIYRSAYDIRDIIEISVKTKHNLDTLMKTIKKLIEELSERFGKTGEDNVIILE